MMVRRDVSGVRLLTRNGHDWSTRFPTIVEAAAGLKMRSCLIDGEAVCCDENGLAVFALLRYRERPADSATGRNGNSNIMPPDSLNPELQQLAKEFSDWWTARASELDKAVRKPLFHYTDMRGMLGIINSEQIWFTSIFHLNDPSELGYGIEMAVSVLHEEAQC